MKLRIILYISLLSVPLLFLSSYSGDPILIPDSGVSITEIENPLPYSTPWVDSVFNSLTTDQRIAQLLMIEVSSNQNRTYYNRIERIIRNYNPGGIIFFRGGPASQVTLTNHWQRISQTPMLVAMDAEWGLAMRLDSTITFPRQITLGAIANERLIYELGLEMGRQARRVGVNMTFSPVVDVNSNPDNPVINSRSFGECRYNVTRKGMAMMFGIQDAGIIATAKHFPGHGDTDVDSHYALPLINHPFQKLDSLHLFPFRHLIDKGLMAVMTAHLNVPSLGPREDLPSSLAPEIVTHLLQNEMGFKGLVVTDALNMRGVTGSYKSGDLEVMALLAGNDILLMPDNVPVAINGIKRAIESGVLDEDVINQKVKKVLYYKEKVGLDNYRPLSVNNLITDLNAPRVHNLNRRLAESAITLLKNDNDLLPLANLDTLRIATLAIGSSTENPFQTMLANYAPVSMYSIQKNHTPQQARNITEQLSKYNLVIISVQNNSMFPGRNYGINQQTIDLVNALSASGNVVLNVFASPYSLHSFGDDLLKAKSIIVSFQDGRDYEEASAQIIFGAVPARGRLPVSVIPYFSIYSGLTTTGRLRIKYGDTEPSGINHGLLQHIDSIAITGIRNRAFPGCQIVVIKDGVMVYNRSFGYHNYQNQTRVKNSDIYDLASLTKILATTSAIMKLVDEGLIDVNNPLGNYLPMARNTNKQNLIIRDILAHQARFRSWIPFYLQTLEDGRPGKKFYSNNNSDEFPVRVAKDLYLHKSHRDSIFHSILTSELLNRKRYIYSDLGFILFAEMIEHVTGESFEKYINDNFIKPLGLQTMGFNPLDRMPTSRLTPTEHDTIFRGQLIHGFVHDPAAAMLGGVAGHAGLFGNATDVAVFMQMLLQEGSYGGRFFFNPAVVKEFTTTQFAGNQNRRGLGFDKPTLKPDRNNPACNSASPFSYGHSGFTGTYAWVDPAENLVYVFLSNRVHPTASNRKISEMSIRTNIHQAIYNAIYYERFLESNRLP